MARFRYQHIKSSVEGKAPTAAQLKVAEIGVNDFAGDEKLFIKNSSGDVVDFPRGYSREYIDDNERVIAEALNDLNSRKMDSSAYTEIWESGVGESSAVLKGSSGTASGDYSVAEGRQTSGTGVASHAEGQGTQANGSYSHAEGYYTETKNESEHVSGRYNVSSSASTTFGDSGNTLFSVGNGISSINKHNAFEIRQNGDIYIVNKDGDDVRLQDEIGNIDVDQVLNDTTSASTNPVSSKAVYKAVTDNELVWTNAFVVISGAISSHTENTEIHVTAADKEKLHTHSNKTYLDSITGNVGTMAYEDKTSYSSATEVNTALGSKANTATTLAGYGITNAYTKSETSGATELTTAFAKYYTTAQTSGATELATAFDNKADKTAVDDLSGQSETVAAALNDLNGRKLDASAYTPTDLSNYYTKSQTSGATELTTAFAAKANTTDLANFFDDAKYEDSGNTKVINFYHGNTIKATIDASDFIVDGMVDNVKIENGYLVIDFNTASGKQDISIPLTDIFDPSNYYDKDDIDDLVGSGFTSSSITEVIIENEEIVSTALTDLDERKLDASAYTPTDLSNYYTKSETSGNTELDTAFSGKLDASAYTPVQIDQVIDSGTSASTNAVATSAVYDYLASNFYTKDDIDNGDEAISASLNNLNTRIIEHSSNAAIHMLQVVSAVTVSADMYDVTCPDDITGVSNNGAQALIVYENSGDTDDYTITVSTLYKTPDGNQLTLTCLANGYCEVSYVNINGMIYVRGI